LSNIEELISEIDSEYWKLRKVIEGCLKQTEGAGLSEREAIALFDNIVKFQNFLESKEIEGRPFNGVAYYKRYSDRFSSILNIVRSEEGIRIFLGRELSSTSFRADMYEHWDGNKGRWADDIQGLVYEAEELVKRSRDGVIAAQKRSLSGMLGNLRDMELQLIKLYGDLRLMSGVKYFGIENQTRVHDDLFSLGFKEALGYLDTAEENLRLEKPHLKDSLANCRLAIESVIYTLADREGIKVIRKFSTDLHELSDKKPRLIDVPTMTMIQGASNFLSVTGSHVFGNVDKDTIELVEQGFSQTYAVLGHLIGKLKGGRNPSEAKA
jgi:hypothetical protein